MSDQTGARGPQDSGPRRGRRQRPAGDQDESTGRTTATEAPRESRPAGGDGPDGRRRLTRTDRNRMGAPKGRPTGPRRSGPGRDGGRDTGRDGGRVTRDDGFRGRPAASTSWDPLAEWYIGWVGEDGSKHHRLLAIPAVMEALEVRRGEQIIDIGCGHGVLSGYVNAAGGIYTGVDASPRLIDFARNHHHRDGRFMVGDAGDLSGQKDLRAGSFDAGVFLLSIQDMDPLAPVLESAARMLKPGGRLVLLMTHPAFRIPRQSGWGWDEGRKLQYRRLDRYLTPLPVPLKSYGERGGVSRSYHRPLQDYVNGLGAVGMAIDRMDEIPTFKVADPGPKASAVNTANKEIPLFVALRALKLR